MASIADTLASAVKHHQSGHLQQAEQLYQEILRVDPHQPDALHLLGVIAAQVGRHEAAIDLMGRAIQLCPKNALYRNNLGNTMRELG